MNVWAFLITAPRKYGLKLSGRLMPRCAMTFTDMDTKETNRGAIIQYPLMSNFSGRGAFYQSLSQAARVQPCCWRITDENQNISECHSRIDCARLRPASHGADDSD